MGNWNNKSKLALRKTGLRILNDHELSMVAGGGTIGADYFDDGFESIIDSGLGDSAVTPETTKCEPTGVPITAQCPMNGQGGSKH